MSYIIGGIIILFALILAVVIFVKIKVELATRRLDCSFLPEIIEMNRMLSQSSNQEENPQKD